MHIIIVYIDYSWSTPFKSEIDKGENAGTTMCGL